MAWQLLNRAYTIGTVDGAGDITPGSAQTGFRDFTSLTSGNTTYVVAVQGSTWSFMTVTKVGAILRPATTHDSSTGSAITFDSGQPISVFSDLGQSKIVYEDGDGTAQNATSVLKTFSPEILTELKTTPLPSSGKSVALLRNILADDKKGAVYTWDPDETTAGDDFNYVVSGLSATGRWVREKPIIEVPNLANDAAAYDGSLYGVSDSLRHKRSDSTVKNIATVETFHQGEFATFAAWQALASSKWSDGDTFVFRGITEENDLGGQRLTFVWDASSTNTDALGVSQIRPTDITGSNPGRAVLTEPSAMSKFTNSDATPSLAGGRFHRCADTVPAAITALDGMIDLQPYWILPGAQDQVFTHSASLLCPGGFDFVLLTTDAPVMVVSDNGVVSVGSGGGALGRSVIAIPSSGIGGTANAIALTLSGGPSITDGLTFSIIPSSANTGAVTVDYNGGGALALVDGEDQALVADALVATAPVVIRYTSSGTKWRLMSGANQSPILVNNAAGSELAISAGTATPTNASHILASESGTSDTLDDIAASAFPAVGRGHFVIKAGHTITVPTAGNISTTTGNTLTFSGGDILEWWRDEAATGVIVSKHQGGLPTGGSTGDVLVKQSATDFDLDWDAPLSVTEDDGTSLPSFTFATPGDLSVVYGTGGDRIIKYQRVGDWLHVMIDMQWTPTHTTASGDGIITGIPVVSSTARNVVCPVYVYSSTPTWPSSGTMVMGLVYTNLGEIRIQSQSSGSNATRWDTAEFTTATARHVRLSCSYPLD